MLLCVRIQRMRIICKFTQIMQICANNAREIYELCKLLEILRPGLFIDKCVVFKVI